MGLSTLCSLFAALHSQGAVVVQAIFEQGNDFILDYSAHLQYVQNPARIYYTNMYANFPPLAYIMYYLLLLVTPVSFEGEWVRMNVQTTYPAMLIYTVYLAVLCALLALMIRRSLRAIPLWKACLAVLGIFVSNVFVVGILERGNSVHFVVILLLAALILRQSENKGYRELALIFIAVATGFKMYPAVFGLLYLKEKRYKEALRLLAYGLILFFGPFVFFGGLDGIRQFFEDLVNVQGANPSVFTISTLGRNLVVALGSPLGLTLSSREQKLASLFFMGLYTLLILFVFWKNREASPWKDIVLLTSLMVLVPSWSGIYTFIYFLPPMLLFFMDPHRGKGPWPFLYTLPYVALFAPLIQLPYAATEWLLAAGAYALVVLVLIQGLLSLRHKGALSALPS